MLLRLVVFLDAKFLSFPFWEGEAVPLFRKIFHSQEQKDKKKRQKKKKKRIWRSESQKKSVSPPYKEKNQLALRVTLLRREKTILTRRSKNSTA